MSIDINNLQQFKMDHLTSEELSSVIYNLQIQQAELKEQNEELKRVQAELEESRNRYSYLYNFTPIGYFTFDRNGIIIRVNQTGANKLGVEKSLLIDKPFFVYIDRNFRDIFFKHLHQVLDTKKKQTCECIKIIDEKGNQFDVQLESILLDNKFLGKVHSTYVMSAMSDITSLKESDKNLRDIEKKLEIKVAEEKFAGIFRRSPTAMAIMSLKDYRIIDINDKWEELFGFSREEALGKDAIELAIWQDRNKQSCVYQRLEKDGIFRNEDCELLRKNGEHWNAIVSFETITVSGEPAILSSVVDVTDRKKAEEELRKSKQQVEELKNFYENIVETITEGLWKIDADAKTTFVNKQLADMLGYTRDELFDKTLYDFVEKSYQESARARFDDRKIGKKDRYESKFVKKDGKSIWVTVSASPLFINSQFSGAIGLLTDITENKYIESKLKESEEKYRSIVEYSNDMIWTEDINGKITFCNRHLAKLLGYKINELIGKYFSNLVDINDTSRIDIFFRNVLNGQPVEYEITLTDKNNENMTISVNKAPIYSKGKVVGATSVGRDITQQKLYEQRIKKTTEELEHSNKELEQFAYIASHDLQEPLRTISSYAELISMRYKGKLDSEAEEFIAYLISGSQRMQQMITDLLMLSRVGRIKNFKLTDINDVIKLSVRNLSNLIKKNQAVILIDKMPIIYADDTLLIQLFQNLIENAIKFRKDKNPKIKINARKIRKISTRKISARKENEGENEENEWIFSVHDNGIGIDPKNFKKLFIIFQRLHGREEYPGTGIGLAICKKIVEHHGGKIWVESKPGEGSTFYFSIPEIVKRRNNNHRY